MGSSPKKIKREPLTDDRVNQNSNSVRSQPLITVKTERVSDKEDDEDEELPIPDPDAPKNYRRIKRVVDSDSDSDDDKRPTTVAGRPSVFDKSDDDDEYVPLCPGKNTNNESSDDVTNSTDESSSRSSPKRNLARRTRASTKKRKLGRSKETDKRYSRSTRQKKRSNDELTDYTSSEMETRSLDGFIVSDDQELSDVEGSTSPSKNNVPKGSIRNKATAPSTRQTRRPNDPQPSKAATSDSDSSDLFIEIPCKKTVGTRSARKQPADDDQTTTKKYQLRPGRNKRRHEVVRDKRKDKTASSSTDESDSESDSKSKKSKKDLSNEVVSELRGFMPSTGPGRVTYKRAPRRRRNSSGNANKHFQDSPVKSGQTDDADSEDSFIDNETGNYGNLESSSLSDEEVVAEDSQILDLNPDNFEEASTSSSEDEDSGPDKSQSDSGSNEDVDAYGTSGNVVSNKCAICANLGDANFRNRDFLVTSDSWCKCGSCKVMSPKMTNYDRICCREIKKVKTFMSEEIGKDAACITEHQRFKKDVLEYGAFLRSYKIRSQGRKERSTKRLEAEFRSATDKEKVNRCKHSFLRWIFDRIGWDNRMVIPTCVVGAIRRRYVPSAGPLYFDAFRPKKICEYAKHCKNAMHGI